MVGLDLRSGKTFIICYALIVRACKTKSRHLICRLRFNHVKTSVWMDTLPKVINLCFPEIANELVWDASNYCLKFPNGSEIWVAGLDDKLRTEKILGAEYSTIFFNECSQIPYSSVSIAMTRLAEKNSLVNKCYFDENPPSKKHWSYSLFILGKDPVEWEDINTDKYAMLLLNPDDNIENIDEHYITEVLDALPPTERDRFKSGKFSEGTEGSIYYAFNRDKHTTDVKWDGRPVYVGIDFNVNPYTAVVSYIDGETIKIFDEFYLKDSNTPKFCIEFKRKYPKAHITMIPDHTGDNRSTKTPNTDFTILRQHFGQKNVIKRRNPFRIDRYASVNACFDKGQIIIHDKLKHLVKDLEQVAYKEGENKPDTSDKSLGHITDALGYLIWHIHPLKIKQISQSRQL